MDRRSFVLKQLVAEVCTLRLYAWSKALSSVLISLILYGGIHNDVHTYVGA